MTKISKVARAVGALFALAVPLAAAAGEIPEAVKIACSGDYEKHCHMHEPLSEGARECMAGVFERLSEPCVSAILDSDLVGGETAGAEHTHAIDTAAAPSSPAAARTARAERSPKRSAKRKAKLAAKRAAKRTAKKRASKQRRRLARNRSYRAKRVARHIRRGTRIARSHVSRALARAFR